MTDKDKQIKELAKDIYSMFRSDSMSRAMASMLYGEGYRKASEVAEEIFAEIEGNSFAYGVNLVIGKETFAELKKKYTEGEGCS